MTEEKTWFARHKILTGILSFIVFIFVIKIFSGSNEPTSIEQKSPDINVDSSSYSIEITGTEGLEFQGSIGSGSNQKSIQGTVPQTYEVSDWPTVAVIQKKTTKGDLTVTIKKNGKVINSQTTNADYGLVTVTS